MQNKHFFYNTNGDKLCGLLTIAEPDKNLIAILCHGHSSGKNNNSWQALEPILVANKISTFRLDFYGNGESEGKFEDSNLSETVDDILQAIKFIKDKGFKKIVLVGSSFGGLSSIIAATRTKDLAALVLKSPVSDYREVNLLKYGKEGMEQWKNQGYRNYDSGDGRQLMLNYSFVTDYQKYDVYEEAKNIKVPTLIVHGDKDETVPFHQSEQLSKVIKNSELVNVQGSDHRYSLPGKFEEMIKIIADYIVSGKF